MESEDHASPRASRPDSARDPFTLVPVHRERFPFRESYLWMPNAPRPVWGRVHDGSDIVFSRGVLAALHALSLRTTGGELVGLLLGRLCECPWTRRSWVKIDAQCGPRPVERGLAGALRELRAQAVAPVGWYHVRPGHGVALDDEEVAIHESLFEEPGSVALLIVPGPGSPEGSVFARVEGEPLDPRRHRPFYEAVSDAVRGIRPAAPTDLAWSAYTRSDPGAAPSVRRVGRLAPVHRRPGLLPTAAVLVGAGAGLALWAELPSRPGILSSSSPSMAFARPQGSSLTAASGERDAREGDAIGAFRARVAAYFALDAATEARERECDALRDAYGAVARGFAAISGGAAEGGPPRAPALVDDPAAQRRAVERRFAESGCDAP